MWYNLKNCNTLINQFSIGYHKAIKKLFNVPKRSSNHIICQAAGLLNFNHLINYTKILFINRIFNNPCNFIAKSNDFLMKHSFLKNHVDEILFNIYNIDDLFINDKNILC